MDRRRFLSAAAAYLALSTLPLDTAAKTSKRVARLAAVRSLSLDVLNTGEKGRQLTYFADGEYQSDVLDELNYLLRDWRRDAIYRMDPKLFDTLYMLQQMTGSTKPYRVTSGYRTPLTNYQLLLDGYKVAAKSLHMDGKAVDLSLPGVRTSKLRDAAVRLGWGGVGSYKGTGFIHVDTGDVRTWKF